jgi:hypothetical protein
VKHFGTIGEAEYPRASCIRRPDGDLTRGK